MLAGMSVPRVEVRASDSALVERVTRVRFEADWHGVTTPDGCWDLVVRRVGGRVELLQTGVITRPIALDYAAGDEYLSISFKPGVFMPRRPGKEMVDRGRVHPTPSARTFHLDGDELELPTFDNAESLIARLTRRELLVRDDIVESVAEGRQRAIHPRAIQRHFVDAMGVTAKRLEQIRRAGRAVDLLAAGKRAVEVALELGYADQSHLTRALKAIMGTTPGQVGRQVSRGPR
jgi:AraC-like DNA-binding protein